MSIGIYADDPGQVENLAGELSAQVLWAAGPRLTGTFAFPVFSDYNRAMTEKPASLVIDCIGDLKDQWALVIPVRAAYFLLEANKKKPALPHAELPAALSQLNSRLDSISELLNLLNDYSKSLSRVGVLLNDATSGIVDDLERTRGILDSVTRIAKRSKIIGLNSAIEAARVGEQGKGFAVVAEEIKTLADDSAQSIQGIERILGGIRKRSGDFSEGTSTISELVSSQQLATAEITAMLQSLKELGQHLKELVGHRPAGRLPALP